MDEFDYKPNSHKFKEGQKKEVSEKRVEKVVTGKAKTKKRSEARKFTDVFISEDAGNVKSYILMDVLVPAIKKAIDDIVSDGIHMILYGGKGRDRNRGSASKVSYSGYYNSRNDRREDRPARGGSAFDYDNIIFDNRGDAESVLDAMEECISQYGLVSVADLYDLADVSTTNYAANRYGWNDIHTAQAVRVRDGWMLKLPRPLPLN